MTAYIVIEHRIVLDSSTAQLFTDLRSILMANAQELKTKLDEMSTRLDTLGTQLDKAKGEIVGATADAAAQIQALRDQLNNAGDIPPDVISAVDKVAASIDAIGQKAQALDDLNPDATT